MKKGKPTSEVDVFNIFIMDLGEDRKVSKVQLVRLIKKNIVAGKSASIMMGDAKQRIISHNPSLDAPIQKLPSMLIRLQYEIYCFWVKDFEETNKEIEHDMEPKKSRRYTFNQMDKGIEKALEGVTEDMQILL